MASYAIGGGSVTAEIKRSLSDFFPRGEASRTITLRARNLSNAIRARGGFAAVGGRASLQVGKAIQNVRASQPIMRLGRGLSTVRTRMPGVGYNLRAGAVASAPVRGVAAAEGLETEVAIEAEIAASAEYAGLLAGAFGSTALLAVGFTGAAILDALHVDVGQEIGRIVGLNDPGQEEQRDLIKANAEHAESIRRRQEGYLGTRTEAHFHPGTRNIDSLSADALQVAAQLAVLLGEETELPVGLNRPVDRKEAEDLLAAIDERELVDTIHNMMDRLDDIVSSNRFQTEEGKVLTAQLTEFLRLFAISRMVPQFRTPSGKPGHATGGLRPYEEEFRRKVWKGGHIMDQAQRYQYENAFADFVKKKELEQRLIDNPPVTTPGGGGGGPPSEPPDGGGGPPGGGGGGDGIPEAVDRIRARVGASIDEAKRELLAIPVVARVVKWITLIYGAYSAGKAIKDLIDSVRKGDAAGAADRVKGWVGKHEKNIPPDMDKPALGLGGTTSIQGVRDLNENPDFLRWVQSSKSGFLDHKVRQSLMKQLLPGGSLDAASFSYEDENGVLHTIRPKDPKVSQSQVDLALLRAYLDTNSRRSYKEVQNELGDLALAYDEEKAAGHATREYTSAHSYQEGESQWKSSEFRQKIARYNPSGGLLDSTVRQSLIDQLTTVRGTDAHRVIRVWKGTPPTLAGLLADKDISSIRSKRDLDMALIDKYFSTFPGEDDPNREAVLGAVEDIQEQIEAGRPVGRMSNRWQIGARIAEAPENVGALNRDSGFLQWLRSSPHLPLFDPLLRSSFLSNLASADLGLTKWIDEKGVQHAVRRRSAADDSFTKGMSPAAADELILRLYLTARQDRGPGVGAGGDFDEVMQRLYANYVKDLRENRVSRTYRPDIPFDSGEYPDLDAEVPSGAAAPAQPKEPTALEPVQPDNPVEEPETVRAGGISGGPAGLSGGELPPRQTEEKTEIDPASRQEVLGASGLLQAGVNAANQGVVYEGSMWGEAPKADLGIRPHKRDLVITSAKQPELTTTQQAEEHPTAVTTAAPPDMENIYRSERDMGYPIKRRRITVI